MVPYAEVMVLSECLIPCHFEMTGEWILWFFEAHPVYLAKVNLEMIEPVYIRRETLLFVCYLNINQKRYIRKNRHELPY